MYVKKRESLLNVWQKLRRKPKKLPEENSREYAGSEEEIEREIAALYGTAI